MQKVLVLNPHYGIKAAKGILYKNVNRNSVLFLSGGKTPKPLYEILAKEGELKSGSVAVVDDRYGSPFHKNSNEKMIRDTGLISYLDLNRIPFYSVLKNKSLKETARNYDSKVRSLFKKFSKRVTILGLGKDGHTASLPAGSEKFKFKSQRFVESVDDFPAEPIERITLTIHALSQMDLIIVLVFGKDKKKGLELLFSEGSIVEAPARFLNTPSISRKALLITDQKI